MRRGSSRGQGTNNPRNRTNYGHERYSSNRPRMPPMEVEGHPSSSRGSRNFRSSASTFVPFQSNSIRPNIMPSTSRGRTCNPINFVRGDRMKKYRKRNAKQKSRVSLNFIRFLNEMKPLTRDASKSVYKAQLRKIWKYFKPKHSRSIQRHMPAICNSLISCLNLAPKHSKLLVIITLGRVGFCIKNFTRYLYWMLMKVAEIHLLDLKNNVLKAMYYALRKHPKALKIANAQKLKKKKAKERKCFFKPLRVQKRFLGIMESAQTPDIAITCANILLHFLTRYNTFKSQISDAVDIVMGLSIDPEQSQDVTKRMHKCIKHLCRYWAANTNFSCIPILDQLVLDLMEAGRKLCVNGVHPLVVCSFHMKPPYRGNLRILMETVYVLKVFATLFRSSMKSVTATAFTKEVGDRLAFSSIQVCRTLLLYFDFQFYNEEALATGNECIWLLLSTLEHNIPQETSNLILYIIQLELEILRKVSPNLRYSILNLINGVLVKCGHIFPPSYVGLLIGPEAAILQFRFSDDLKLHKLTVSIYQNLLRLNGVRIMQEAYSYILSDMERAFIVISPTAQLFCVPNFFQTTVYTYSEANLVFLFHLKILAILTNADRSNLKIWALQPDLFYLFTEHLSKISARRNQFLLHSVLLLLVAFCKMHSNFVLSSDLVNEINPKYMHLQNQSLTSRYFGNIIDLIREILSSRSIWCDSLHLVLRWSNVAISDALNYHESLLQCEKICSLINHILSFGMSSKSVIGVIQICEILENLVKKPHFSKIPIKTLELIADFCFVHLNSSHQSISRRVTEIMLFIPWSIPAAALNNYLKSQLAGCLNVLSFGRGRYENMLYTENSKVFDIFVRAIAVKYKNYDEMVKVIIESYENRGRTLTTKGRTMTNSSVVLALLTWDSAQYCIQNRLRTSFGDATNFFAFLDDYVTSCIREKNIERSDLLVSQIRLFLEFIENISKSVHNAVCHTSHSMPSPSEASRIFFKESRYIFTEWFIRIRFRLIKVALYSEDYHTVVRHSWGYLQYRKNEENLDIEFEKVVTFLATAYCRLKEPEDLKGLKIWCQRTVSTCYFIFEPARKQAAGAYEEAAAMYLNIVNSGVDKLKTSNVLNEEDENSMLCSYLNENPICKLPRFVKNFLSERIIECHTGLKDWKRLKMWKEYLPNFLSEISINSSPMHYRNLSTTDVDVLEHFDLALVSELSENKYQSKKVNEFTNNWYNDFNPINTKLEFLSTIANESTSKRNIIKYFEDIRVHLKENLRTLPASNSCKWYSMLQTAAPAPELILNIHSETRGLTSEVVMDGIFWRNATSKLTQVTFDSSSHYLMASKLALTEGNVLSSMKNLAFYFHEISKLEENPIKINEKTSVLSELQNVYYSHYWKNSNSLKAHEGDAIVQFADICKRINLPEEALKVYFFITEKFIKSSDFSSTKKCVLKLVATLSNVDSVFNEEYYNAKYLMKTFQEWTRDSELQQFFNSLCSKNALMSHNEIMSEKITMMSALVINDSDLWMKLGDTCYDWLKMHENPLESVKDKILLDSSFFSIQHNVDNICQVFDHFLKNDDNNADGILASLQDSLRPLLTPLDVDQLKKLTDLWLFLSSDLAFKYNFLAYQCYANFIKNNKDSEASGNSHHAMLRLIDLLLSSNNLNPKECLQLALEIPTSYWVNMVDQLFAYISHPKSNVRQSIQLILCHISDDYPDKVAFKAVVESDSGYPGVINSLPIAGLMTIKDFDASFLKHGSYPTTEEYLQTLSLSVASMEDFPRTKIQTAQNVRTSSLPTIEQTVETQLQIIRKEKSSSVIVDYIKIKNSEIIYRNISLVNAFRRISLLWDELWCGTLNHHAPKIAILFNNLTTELKSLRSKRELPRNVIAAIKSSLCNAYMHPIVYLLSSLNAVTKGAPTTKHELLFKKRYQNYIDATLRAARKPFRNETQVSKFKSSFDFLKQRFNDGLKRKLAMSDICFMLGALKNSEIPIPGSESSGTILGVAPVVHVLPTKTKPKKFKILGSNGKTYVFLLKGLEDLHLDSRIMSFLKYANKLHDNSEYLSAKHYPVIPIGMFGGLIGWVHDATSLYTVLKKWYQMTVGEEMRPIDEYYKKIKALTSIRDMKNIHRAENGAQILLMAFQSMRDSTPKDLLAKEFWYQSENIGHWWQINRQYCSSLAGMSVIGYIIGLGDRHLDNILVNFNTGQIVHIDYSVCFEKGNALRIPEIVPFRMTQNLEGALGLTGTDGYFHSVTANVLDILRKNKYNIMTLLNSFIYDPTSDWMDGIGSGYSGSNYASSSNKLAYVERSIGERTLEVDILQLLIAARLLKSQVQVSNSKNDWKKFIQSVKDLTHSYIDLSTMNEEKQRKLIEFQNQLEESEENEELIKFLKLSEELIEVGRMYTEISRSYEFLFQPSGRNLQTVVDRLNKFVAEGMNSFIPPPCYMFLINRNKPITARKYRDACRKYAHVCHEYLQALKKVVGSLSQYNVMKNCYPTDFIDKHRAKFYPDIIATELSLEVLYTSNELTDAKEKFGFGGVCDDSRKEFSKFLQETLTHYEGLCFGIDKSMFTAHSTKMLTHITKYRTAVEMSIPDLLHGLCSVTKCLIDNYFDGKIMEKLTATGKVLLNGDQGGELLLANINGKCTILYGLLLIMSSIGSKFVLPLQPNFMNLNDFIKHISSVDAAFYNTGVAKKVLVCQVFYPLLENALMSSAVMGFLDAHQIFINSLPVSLSELYEQFKIEVSDSEQSRNLEYHEIIRIFHAEYQRKLSRLFGIPDNKQELGPILSRIHTLIRDLDMALRKLCNMFDYFSGMRFVNPHIDLFKQQKPPCFRSRGMRDSCMNVLYCKFYSLLSLNVSRIINMKCIIHNDNIPTEPAQFVEIEKEVDDYFNTFYSLVLSNIMTCVNSYTLSHILNYFLTEGHFHVTGANMVKMEDFAELGKENFYKHMTSRMVAPPDAQNTQIYDHIQDLSHICNRIIYDLYILQKETFNISCIYSVKHFISIYSWMWNVPNSNQLMTSYEKWRQNNDVQTLVAATANLVDAAKGLGITTRRVVCLFGRASNNDAPLKEFLINLKGSLKARYDCIEKAKDITKEVGDIRNCLEMFEDIRRDRGDATRFGDVEKLICDHANLCNAISSKTKPSRNDPSDDEEDEKVEEEEKEEEKEEEEEDFTNIARSFVLEALASVKKELARFKAIKKGYGMTYKMIKCRLIGMKKGFLAATRPAHRLLKQFKKIAPRNGLDLIVETYFYQRRLFLKTIRMMIMYVPRQRRVYELVPNIWKYGESGFTFGAMLFYNQLLILEKKSDQFITNLLRLPYEIFKQTNEVKKDFTKAFAAEFKAKLESNEVVKNRNAKKALNTIWRKLQGKHFKTNQILSTSDQASQIISEARDTNSLSKIYEGWCPWV